MTSRLPLYILVLVLLTVGIGLSIHRHVAYEVPWSPGEPQTIWSIEAKVEFAADGGPVSASLVRPQNQPGYIVLKETGASPGYGLSLLDVNNSPRAEWTIRQGEGPTQLFYRAEVLVAPNENPPAPPVPSINPPTWEEPYGTAVRQILAGAHGTSADAFSMVRQLLKAFSAPEPDQNVQLLVSHYHKRGLPQLITGMLHEAQIPASVVYALALEDGRRRQSLVPMLRVWQGEESRVVPFPGSELQPDMPLLLWEQNGAPILDVMGGRDSTVTFSMLQRQEGTANAIASKLSTRNDLINFSIHSLPLEEQAMFKTILLLPIGALVVCFLRIIIGLKTAGTFMPVLIAVAFMQTSLLTGLIIFLMVIGMGLLVRSYLSKLNLLLVARITFVIITVILIISIVSVLSYRIGLSEGLKITFFPMIIMSWTVERMSILWEEEGWNEVFVQGGGSLLTAVLAYLAMTNPWVKHLTFNFIGLQFVIMALVVMLGTYTGYRLSELKRFKPLVSK